MSYEDALFTIVEEGMKNGGPGHNFNLVRFCSSPLFMWMKFTAKELDKPRTRG